jgi:4-alpha-glucanotransferase
VSAQPGSPEPTDAARRGGPDEQADPPSGDSTLPTPVASGPIEIPPPPEPDGEPELADPEVEAEFDDESDDEAAAREEAAAEELAAGAPAGEELAAGAAAGEAFDAFAPAQPQEPSPQLDELAKAYGVSTEFSDWQGRHTHVSRRTIVAVLRALEVDASTEDAVTRALAEVRERPWRRMLPDVVVVRQGEVARVPVHAPHEAAVQVWVDLEDGGRHVLEQQDHGAEPREIDGVLVGEAAFALPPDLPLGWHRLRARHDGGEAERPLVVTPARLALPPTLQGGRAWGFMTQLYSVRSRFSWGLGDLADLAELADWSARDHGAGFVLVNPLHAAEPVPPMEASPYLPTTRRFVNPVYLRVEDIREVGYMPSTDRALVEWQAEPMRGLDTSPDPLDRDAVWLAKKAALETVFAQPRSRSRQARFETFCAREGQGLIDFATWCALADRYGLPMSTWPDLARDPRSEAVRQIREEMSGRVEFYMWLQWCLDEQLAAAQRTALEAGMPIGVVHDLAVGVHPEGADTWALAGVLAHEVTVGAPPDAFNQQGQDWSQPPWRPDRLAELGYAPFRDMIRTVLRHAGGLRVDHVIGLFRLWWVPAGLGAAEGTYVTYDHEAMIGILALEAHRSGAFIVGEDLGTVEPWVRDYLRERGVLGTSILWFERNWDTGRPLPPQEWRELCLATVTTHDLPPTAGYLANEHIELRDRLGLLTRSVEEEEAAANADLDSVLAQLQDLGLLKPDATEREKVEALHRFLLLTPARLLGVALADAVGDRRAINQPGTYDEYPNWRLPLSDGVGQPLLLEDVMTAIRAQSLARTVQHL